MRTAKGDPGGMTTWIKYGCQQSYLDAFLEVKVIGNCMRFTTPNGAASKLFLASVSQNWGNLGKYFGRFERLNAQ